MTNINFTQLCVWPGCLVGDNSKQNEFVKFMEDNLHARVIYSEEVKTLPDNEGEGGRNDLLFFIHAEDIPYFAIPRLEYGISWWEDALSNWGHLYPSEIRNKYPNTWKNNEYE